MRRGHLLAGAAVLGLLPATAAGSWASAQWVSPPRAGVHAEPSAAWSAGRGLVAWVRSARGGEAAGKVQVSWRPRSGAWSAPRTLSGPGGRSPRAALDSRGRAAVAWLSGRAIVVGVRSTRSARWSVSRAARAEGDIADLLLVLDRRGRPLVMWSERRGGGFLVRLASWPSGQRGWSVRPARLGTPGPAPPSLALRAGAGALVAWTAGGRVRASRTVNGVFEPSFELAAARASGPAAALAPGGRGLVAWAVRLPGGTSLLLGGERGGAEQGWGEAEDLGVGEAPYAAVNDAGDAVVAWTDGAAGAPQGIEAATRRGRGAWRAATVIGARACCALGVTGVAMDARGGALVAWRRDGDTSGRGGGVASARAGDSVWTTLRTTARAGPPVVAAGLGGGALAAWIDGGVRAAVSEGTLASGGATASIAARRTRARGGR